MRRLIICCVAFMMVGCVQKQEEEITQKEKKEIKEKSKEELIEIIYPTNLLIGNSPEKMLAFYEKNTKENTPKDSTPVDEQMSKYYIDGDGFLVEGYTQKQIKMRKQLMYDSAKMKPYLQKEQSAIRRVEYVNDNLTKANVYVVKDEYEGGVKGSLNEFSRILVKIYITTFMGAYQVYSGVKPDDWKVHLNIYDVDTKKLLYEYDYPTEEFPKLKI